MRATFGQINRVGHWPVVTLCVCLLIGSLVGLSSGPASAGSSSRQTPANVTNISVKQTDDIVTVSWTEPSDVGQSDITKYEVSAVTDPGGILADQGCVASGSYPVTTACKVIGLSPGSYIFTVVPYNDQGAGDSASSSAFTVAGTATVPDPPTNPAAEQTAPNKITIRWQAPASDGGSPIKKYIVRALTYPGDALVNYMDCDATPPQTSCDISGLVIDSTHGYYFSVTATNDVGESNPVNTSSVTGASLSAPGTATATRGDQSATVAWDPLPEPYTPQVTKYTVAVYTAGTVVSAKGCSTEGAPPLTQCTVTGLDNGTAYTFAVSAQGSDFSSQPSAQSNAVTPASAPLAPVSVTANETADSVTVSWSGASGNGLDIDYYVVTAYDGADAGPSAQVTSTSHKFTDLVRGHTYTFTVLVHNEIGDTTSDPSQPFTWKADLAAPIDVQAGLHGTDGASISWQAATQPYIDVDQFTVTALLDGSTDTQIQCTTERDGSTPAANSCDVTGLTPGSRYKFTVTASAAAGNSATSAPSGFLKVGIPATPTGVQVSRSGPDILVSWSAGVGGGTGPFTYQVLAVADGSSSPGAQACEPTDQLQCTVTGFNDNTPYRFTVTASNQYGDSQASDPSDAIAAGATPEQVAAPTATGNEGYQITISWSVPAGATPTGYRVYAIDGLNPPTNPVCDTTSTSCTVGNDLWYGYWRFTVVAYNAVGDAPVSDPSNKVDLGLAAAPAELTAQMNGQKVDLSWTVPYLGRLGTAEYRITTHADGETDQSFDAESTSWQFSNLTPGVSYEITVVSHNMLGESAPTSITFTPGMPDAPTSVSVAATSNTQAHVTWNASTKDGGWPITGYKVVLFANNAQGETYDASPTATGLDISGLSTDIEYTFKVQAYNSYASSALSDPSNMIQMGQPPERVTITGTVAGNHQIKPIFDQPARPDGAFIKSYEVTAYQGSNPVGTCSASYCYGVATTCWVTGLTNGVSYQMTVVTVASSGRSLPAISPAVVPSGPPSVPTNFTGVAGSKEVSLSWSAPIDQSFYPITTYTVKSNVTGVGCTTSGSSPEMSCTLTGLTDGVSYQFSLSATNSNNSESERAYLTLTPTSLPSAPTAVNTTVGTGQVLVSWSPPLDLGGLPIDKYQVQVFADDYELVGYGCTNTLPALATSCRVQGLVDGFSYRFVITATNAQGEGLAAEVSAVPVAGVPTPPLNVTISTGVSGQLIAQWNAPALSGASEITSYIARAYLPANLPADSASAATGSVSSCVIDESPLAQSCHINGLTDGTSYQVVVQAVNAAGAGELSSPSASAAPVNPLHNFTWADIDGNERTYRYSPPDGMTHLKIVLSGSGGTGFGAPGGHGSRATSTIAANPEQKFQITLGNAGMDPMHAQANYPASPGANGGGMSFSPGGGASDIRIGDCVDTLSCGLDDRVLVAGGGGGGGNQGVPGGDAGYPAGSDGGGTPAKGQGKGATATSGGAGGVQYRPDGAPLDFPEYLGGDAGTKGQGGSSLSYMDTSRLGLGGGWAPTGGGGGGYYGGGGGSQFGAGGGGSSYFDASVFPNTTFDLNSSIGSIELTGYGPPDAVTSRANDITQTTATVFADVTPNNSTTTTEFVYSKDPTFASGVATMPLASALNGYTEQLASVQLTGLDPGTTYYYRAEASNAESPYKASANATDGGSRSFTTLGAPPSPTDPSSPSEPGSPPDPVPDPSQPSAPGTLPSPSTDTRYQLSFVDTPAAVLRGTSVPLSLSVSSHNRAPVNGTAVVKQDGQLICTLTISAGRGSCTSPRIKRLGTYQFAATFTASDTRQARARTQVLATTVTIERAPVQLHLCQAKTHIAGKALGHRKAVKILRQVGSRWIQSGSVTTSARGAWRSTQQLQQIKTVFKARIGKHTSQLVTVRFSDAKPNHKTRGC